MIPTRLAFSFSSAFSAGRESSRSRLRPLRRRSRRVALRKVPRRAVLGLSEGCQWRGPTTAPALATRRWIFSWPSRGDGKSKTSGRTNRQLATIRGSVLRRGVRFRFAVFLWRPIAKRWNRQPRLLSRNSLPSAREARGRRSNFFHCVAIALLKPDNARTGRQVLRDSNLFEVRWKMWRFGSTLIPGLYGIRAEIVAPKGQVRACSKNSESIDTRILSIGMNGRPRSICLDKSSSNEPTPPFRLPVSSHTSP